jgi:hypothetical protein
MSENNKPRKVFLSYAAGDRDIACKILEEARRQKLDTSLWLDTLELPPGGEIDKALNKILSASDYLLIVLSPKSAMSRWMQYEWESVLSRQLTKRDITLLPVIIGDVEIPHALKSYQFLDLRGDFQQGVKRLVEQISRAPEIDFSRLNWKEFEDLVADLLTKLDFKNIERRVRVNNSEFDFTAEYLRDDPLEGRSSEKWVCEVKFYRHERADLKSVKQFLSELTELAPQSHGLLVTNSQLTSVVNDWLKAAESKAHKDVRVIDGPKLKLLLLKHQDLVDKYFMKTAA